MTRTVTRDRSSARAASGWSRPASARAWSAAPRSCCTRWPSGCRTAAGTSRSSPPRAMNHHTWENELPAGESISDDGLTVRRFPAVFQQTGRAAEARGRDHGRPPGLDRRPAALDQRRHALARAVPLPARPRRRLPRADLHAVPVLDRLRLLAAAARALGAVDLPARRALRLPRAVPADVHRRRRAAAADRARARAGAPGAPSSARTRWSAAASRSRSPTTPRASASATASRAGSCSTPAAARAPRAGSSCSTSWPGRPSGATCRSRWSPWAAATSTRRSGSRTR